MNINERALYLIHPLGENWMPGETDMSRIANIMPPLGLCSISAWMEQHDWQTEIYDCYAFPGDDKRLFKQLERDRPLWIGFSTTTSSFPDAIRLANHCREILPEAKIVFGGVHVSALREQLMNEFYVIDYIIVGEGEQTLLELIECKSEDLSHIEGLIWRDGHEAVFNGHRRDLLNLDTLPIPAYHKLHGFPEAYKLPIFNYPKAPGTTIITSRGCPFRCSYCDRSVFQSSYRFNSADYILRMMKHLHDTYGMRHVNIYDDTFTLQRKRIEEFCEKKIASGLKMTFNCAARAEQVDPEMLKLMKKAGCWMISLGIETGDPELLKRHRYYAGRIPDDALDMNRDAVRMIRRAGIRAKGLFMLGLPGETEESIERSIRYVLSLPLDDFNLSKFTPFPGSPAYQTIHDFGEFDEDWSLMNALNFVFVAKGFTMERLEERHREFYRRYYQRHKVMWNYVTMLWKSPDSWHRFIKDLSVFLSFRKKYAT